MEIWSQLYTYTPTHIHPLLLNIQFLEISDLSFSYYVDSIKYIKWNGSLISSHLIDIYLKIIQTCSLLFDLGFHFYIHVMAFLF